MARTPIRKRWIFPLALAPIALEPNEYELANQGWANAARNRTDEDDAPDPRAEEAGPSRDVESEG